MGNSLGILFRHNLWANLQLLDVCADIGEELLDAAAPGTYGRVSDTLVHLFAAEQRYTEMLGGEPFSAKVHESSGFPGVELLRQSAQESGQRLIAIAESMAFNEFLTVVTQDETFELPGAMLLLQAINHATEHRNHIVSILSQSGVELPDMDGWSYEDELRAYLQSLE